MMRGRFGSYAADVGPDAGADGGAHIRPPERLGRADNDLGGAGDEVRGYTVIAADLGEWACPRCGQDGRRCRSDDGKQRPVHLVRLVIGLVLRAAQWCAGRLSREQRMLLATLVLGVDQEPPAAVTDRSGEDWPEAANALRQGNLLLRQLSRTVRAVADPYLDTDDLCEAIKDLGRQADDAANVLQEVETGAPADAATLDGFVFPSPALLRLATIWRGCRNPARSPPRSVPCGSRSGMGCFPSG